MSCTRDHAGSFSDVQITFYDQESPYDYYGNMRFDGNGGLPIGMSADHNRLNGLARYDDNSTSPPADLAPFDPIGGYPSGLRWRGTQSLNGEALASGVETALGGLPATKVISDDAGPMVGWEGNPYLANDPRVGRAPELGRPVAVQPPQRVSGALRRHVEQAAAVQPRRGSVARRQPHPPRLRHGHGHAPKGRAPQDALGVGQGRHEVGRPEKDEGASVEALHNAVRL